MMFYSLDQLRPSASTSQESSYSSGPRNRSWSYRTRIGNREASWRPATLRTPVLVSVVAVSIILIILLEYVSLQSSRYGYITYSGLDGDFAPIQSFSFLYLPTTLAVLYSLLWSWIDLDAKRLEPYFQLAKSCGASAERSLLLHYPVDFLAFVPIKAVKLK